MEVKAAAPAVRRRMWLLVAFAVVGAAAAYAAERNFPFDQELLLDTAPMRDSNRVPSLEVLSSGLALIDLWCARGRGRVRVEGAAITIVPLSMDRASCSPDSLQHDVDMLSALTQITTWRREDDAVVLIGPQTLRYHVSSH